MKLFYISTFSLLVLTTVVMLAIGLQHNPTETPTIAVAERRIAGTAAPCAGNTTDTLRLVGHHFLLDSNYAPTDLVEVYTLSRIFSINISLAGMQLRQEARIGLESLLAALENEGFEKLLLVSGFRDYDTQAALYNSSRYDVVVADCGTELFNIAMPGASEHQLGLAIDLQTVDGNLRDFHLTQAGAWLHDNAHYYGWIVRNREIDEALTNIISEPWHFRYVGVPHAAVMQYLDVCLEQYLDLLRENIVTDIHIRGQSWQVQYFADGEEVFVPATHLYTTSSDVYGGTLVTIRR